MNATAMTASDNAPWYRHRWPWLLMLGPAIVVVAGLFTAWLALRSDDGLVADDYYKRGLLVNRDIERTARAAGLQAQATIAGSGAVRVSLAGFADEAPASVSVRIANATRAELDRTATLARTPDGTYAGAVAPLTAGRWIVTLQTETWRLPPVELAGASGELRFKGGPR